MLKENEIKNYHNKPYTFNEFKAIIISLQEDNYEIYIGSDSQVVKNRVHVVTCVCAYKQGSGGRVFYVKEKVDKKKFPTTRIRLLHEAYKSIEAAIEIEEFVYGKLIVHLDIGDNIIKSMSAKYKKEIESVVLSMGYDCEIKPHSWASSVADRFTKN